MSKFREIRRELHRIPEPGFQEVKTQALLLKYLRQLPADRVEIKTWCTGILVRIKGTIGKRRIAYRADIDGLPITEETSYEFRSEHEGYMHACGHDMHMAIAVGVASHFAHHPIEDDVIVIFQPAEEGPGGAEPMMRSEEYRAWKPDLILALHIAPEYPVGQIAVRPGTLFARTAEIFIELKGKGGHAAYPHQAKDMIIAAAQLVMQLQTIISRNLDPLDAAVITIGKITGGVRQNVIAERVRLEGTIRTLSDAATKTVRSRIEDILHGIEAGYGCEATVEYGADYVQVDNDEALTKEFMAWMRGEQQQVEEPLRMELVECGAAMTGEDFGFFLTETPGFMFWLGVDSPYGLHHAKLEPKEEAIDQAISLVTRYITWKSRQHAGKEQRDR
ncbi:N-acetyldiaminopimelate deacetylase [Insulibacter thermoxylanivorax]|uniref:N-acetyldiaminopimelate deacetylase n=1 Tax=Insulibacter thermoxylanivorax TaxID=2749268 RepID=A0A916VF54_9BACL|nr:N-acetyldiaminopimelate deacetylase [Insulibacter thermoxylanivorax]GFR37493.1 N-acetyldiaminopimelate deacetylase [Insulibacter thermoxylanivorax]